MPFEPEVLPTPATIVLAGATGELGRRIATHLLRHGAEVRALVRPGGSMEARQGLHDAGALVKEVDHSNVADLTRVCVGATCLVSALSGLWGSIVDTQMRLLEAAVAAKVPRFIPSDFAADLYKLPYGTNRNFDFRKKFAEHLDKAPIRATSILNGMFADLLTGQAPVVLTPIKRVMYYGNADQLLDFTTMDNTAEYTAAAAMDPSTPRFLRIAGDVLSACGLQQAATEATGQKFGTIRPGGLGVLAAMIKMTRFFAPAKDEVFPAWQGMQYLHDMLSGVVKLHPLNNDRYPGIRWMTVREVLEQRGK